MASKKNLSDKVLERAQEKRRNTSSYSAANTDKDKSIAERSLELAQKRMAERAAMAATRRAAEEASAQSAPPTRPDASFLQNGRARTNLYGTGFGRAYHNMFTQPHLDAQEKARQAAADRILGEFGYKNIAGKAVFTTPHNQLPKPTEENTASLMQAPGAYGIKPQDFAQLMDDIKAFKTMKKPETTIEPPEVDFIAKWFPDADYEPSAMDMMDKADELEGEQLNEYYADYEAYVANADKVRDNDQTAREYDRAYPEAEARYNAAINLLGEDALNYLDETPADYYGRYANLHKSHANNTDDWWDEYKANSRMTEEISLEEANRLERYNSNISDAPGGAARWSQTTKKERAMYEYMRDMFGHEAAEGYIESKFPELNQRLAAATQELATEFAEENPVLASAGTVAEAPGRGIEFAGMMLDHYLGKDVDAYDPRLNATRYSDTVRSVVPQDMGGFGKFAYSTGMSIADNLANRLTYGWIPYAGTALQSLNMGASSGASTYIDVYDRTGDKDLAMAAATASGAVETIFEKISLDKLIKMGEPGTWKTAIVNVLKQMGIEGSEELATSIANELTDRYLMGENSNYELAVKNYMKEGNSEAAARRLANMDFAKQAAMDFAGGSASGLVMGGSQQAGSYFAARSYENAKGTQPAAFTENDLTEQLDADIEEQVSIAARQAVEVLERENAMPSDEVLADYMDTSTQPEAETPAVQQPARPAVETPAVQQPARPAVETPAVQQPARPAAETPEAQQTSQPASTAQEERTQPSTPVQSERTQPEARKQVDYSDRTGAKKITGRSFMSELNAVSPDRMRGGRNVTITDAYRNENGSLMLVGENKKGRTITAEQSILLDHQSITENLLDNIAHFAPSIGYGENSAVEINECVKNYDSMLGDKKEYVKDFNKVYQYAQMGMTPEEIKADDAYKGHLSDKAFEAAYSLGAEKAPNIDFKTQDQQREEAAEAYKQSGQKPENAIEFADGSVFGAGTVKMDGNGTELTPVAMSTNENGERVITAVDSNGKTHTATLGNTMFADKEAQTLFGRFMVDTFDIDQHRDHRGIAHLLTDEALPAYIDGFDSSRVSGEDVEAKVGKYAKEFYRVYKAGESGQTLEQMADGNEGILDRIHEVLSDETIEKAYAAGQNTPEAQKARRVADVNAQKTAEANAKAEAAKPAPETKTEAAKPAAQPAPETKAADKPAAQERTEEKPKKSRGKTQLFHAEQGATYTDENGDQHNLDVLGVESVDNGMPVLQVRDENGEIDYLSASELDIEGSYGELMAYEGVARMDAKALRNYLEGYNPDMATPKQYAKAYNAVYQRGVSGLDFEQAYNRSNMARAHMSKGAATDAYAAGLNVFNANHESVQAAETRNDAGAHVVAGNAPLSAQEGRKGGKISKRYTQAAFANMSKEGRNNAIAQMEMLSALASRTGRTIVVEDSIVGPNGTQANAYYDPKTGEIHIALDAVGGAYTYAAMHELTHAIKAEHKQEWGGFVDFVKGALEKNGSSFDQLVQYQMDRFGYSRALAEEEVICNTVPALLQDDRNMLELYRGNRTLFERVVDWVRGLLKDIKAAGDVLSKRSASWAQMDALKNDRQTLQEMYDRMMAIFEKGPELRADDQVAEFERNMVEGVTASVTEAPVGENGEPIKYSLTTYNETLPKPISVGRAKAMGLEYEVQKLGAKGKRTVAASGRDVTEALMRKEGFDDKTINKVLKYADRISKWFEKAVGRYEFVNLQDVNDASIMIDHNTGEIKFSCQVPNSEYKVNFDFTTVCRQREAVQRFIDDLAKEKGANGTKLEDIQLTPQNIFKLNTILKNEGYETACLGCFVEAKRYRIKQQADTLVEEWNALVLAQNPDAEYFGFATGDTDLMKMSNDEVTKLEASMRAYSTKGTSKATDRAARLVQLPEMQKLLRPSDFISRQGRQKIREFSPALESFLASRFGQGGAKPAVGFMPYNSEVAALPDTKSVGGKRMTLQQYLKNLGGGRSNSFSDYIPSHALDYLQRTIDMAARRLPAQCYTKVPGRARTFGMTGEKINMSVMFDIDPDVHWSSAGLGKDGEYLVGDKARADKIEKETGERPFTQSFPWEEAVAIEHDPRYAENCGIIGVGYSYKHILKMMADGNIPYIIAYHRSAMPDSVAKASNTKHATNYEPVQNNTRVTGYAVVTNLQEGDGVPSYATWPEGKKKTKASDMTWDMQAALKRHGGDARAAIAEWHAWMEKNNLTPVTSTAEAGHGKFDVYASLNRTMDPAKTANEYMAHCIENGMLPVFYEFATFENYDKHLFDFSVRNLATGTVAPQKNVSFDFMDRVTEDDFMAMLDADMTEYNDYNRDQFHSEKWGRVKETAYEELRYSLRDEQTQTPEFKTWFGDSKIVDEDGKPKVVYHGTNGGDFNVFDWGHTQRADAGWYGRGHYFATSKGEAEMYGDRVVEAYLKIEKPFNFRKEMRMLDGKKTGTVASRNVVTDNVLFAINAAEKFKPIFGENKYQAYDEAKGEGVEIKWADMRRMVDDVINSGKLKLLNFGSYYKWQYQSGEGFFGDYTGFEEYRTKEDAEKEKWNAAADLLFGRRYRIDFPLSPEAAYLGGDMTKADKLTELLKKKGYDGVIQSEDGDEIVVFDSTQIKSATENAGTFDPKNPDIRYSLRDTDENVQDALSAEQKAFNLVKGHRINAAEADKIAGEVLKQANSDYDRQKLAAEISRIYDYVERGVDVDWLQVDDETTSLMAKVMESSKSINLEHEEMAKPIREYLRKTGISLTEAQRKQAENMSGTYGAYRKQLFGRVRLTSVGGKSLTSVWADLTAMNSELFPADASEDEQAALLVAAVDALKPVYENNSGMNVEESAAWLAGKMNESYFSLPSVKASAKSGKTFGESVANLKEAMKRFEATSWSEYQNALRKIREARGNEARTKKQEEVAALREKYVKWREKDSANRKERELVAKYRAKVERSAKTLANWIDKPTDSKHIPMNVEKSVREMLGVLDFSGKGTKNATELANRLNALADSLKEAQEGEDENRTMFLERDQQMIDEIKRLSEIIKGNAEHDARSGRGVYDLNGLELKELSKWLDVIKKTVTEAGKMRGSNLPGSTVEEVAAASMFEIGRKKAYKDRSNISKALGQVYGPDMQDSFSFFERLGPTTNAVFKELRKGFDTMAGLVGEAEERTKTILNGLNLKKISGKKAEKHKFQLKSGEVELTTGQIMELYVLSKRQQAQGHLYGGGFRVQGDQNARPYTIDEEELARITATLTPEERNAADGMQAFLSKECAAWGNKTSVELLGYKKFGEEFYWPISTDPNQRNTTKLEDNFGANISAIKNQGMTKALTEGASNALVIGDIFDTYTRHISNMAAYSAYALPLSDFTRWYNARGVKTEIEHALGKKGIDYINQFLMALNGSAQQEQKSGLAKITTTMTRNAKIAAVGSNVRVVVQQPTSYARAAMYMSPKYLSGALTMKKPDENLVNKYCAIARWKRWGFYETNVGPNLRRLIVGDAPAMDVVREKMTALAAAGDNWTLNHLWNACELETRAVYPELKRGSEEYYTQVGNRMSEIIDRTQVVDSVFHRSQMMRSKNWINQSLTNFMAEPTKTYNMLMSAINDYAENRKNKAARNRVARAFGVYAMTGVLTAAAAGLVDAFRDTDEEETWAEKYLNAVKSNTIGNLNPLGLLPGVSKVLGMLEGYESSNLDTQSIQRLIWAKDEIKKYVEGESKQNLYGIAYKVMQAFSSVIGLPISNLMRDGNAVWQTVTGRSPTLNAEGRKSATTDLLYGAIMKGEKAKAGKLREELLTQAGMSPKDVETAIARKLAEDPRVIEAYNAKTMRDFKTTNRLINELTAQGFDREAVDKAITLQEPKEPAEKDPDAKLRVKLYKAEDVANAIKVLAGMESGNATEMDVKTMMFELAVDSSSQTDINVQIRNDIANVLKPEYLAMEAAGDEEGMRRLESLLENLFEYEDYDIKEKMHGWVKTQHSDALKTAVQAYNLTDALKAVEVMRGDGKTDSEIKSSLSSYKQIYIDAVNAGDSETALKIQRTLMGLGLKGKTGKALYTSQTFTDWLRN